MTTQYTSLLGLALPVTGELSGTWGDIVNDSITQLTEDSIANYAEADVSSGDWTLTTTGTGAPNQARMMILRPYGTPGVSRNIIAPSKSKLYVVLNTSDEVVVLKGAATTGVQIQSYSGALCAWDGADFVSVSDVIGPDSATDTAIAVYDGTTGKVIKNTGVTIDGSNNVTIPGQADLRWADSDSSNWVAFQAPATVPANITLTLPDSDGDPDQVLTTDGAGNLSWSTPALPSTFIETVTTIGTIATSTYDLDIGSATVFDITLGTNVTLTFTNVPAAGLTKPITLIVRQPAVSPGHTLTITGAQYTDASAPILSTGANQKDVLTYWSIDGGTTYFGTFAMANVS